MSEEQTETTTDFSVPEAYAEKGWAQNIKSHDDLWNQFSNAQELIGRRPAGIPTDDSSDEDWIKFLDSMRPNAPDAYEFSLGDDLKLPENFDLSPYEEKAKAFFHEIGLSKKMANKAWNQYLKMELEASNENRSAMEAKQAELDAEYDKLSAELYGDKYSQVEKQAIDFISQALPEELASVVSNDIAGNPKALLAMVKLADYAQSQINEVKSKYGAEDKLASGAQTAGMSQQEVLQKLVEQRMLAKTAEPFSAERKKAEEEMDKLRKMLK